VGAVGCRLTHLRSSPSSPGSVAVECGARWCQQSHPPPPERQARPHRRQRCVDGPPPVAPSAVLAAPRRQGCGEQRGGRVSRCGGQWSRHHSRVAIEPAWAWAWRGGAPEAIPTASMNQPSCRETGPSKRDTDGGCCCCQPLRARPAPGPRLVHTYVLGDDDLIRGRRRRTTMV
jgi:hypothetical protein